MNTNNFFKIILCNIIDRLLINCKYLFNRGLDFHLPHVIVLLGLFEAMVQSPGSLSSLRHDSLPAMLYRDQQVLDEDHVLLLTEVFQVSALFVQVKHCFAVGCDFLLEGFVLFDLGCGENFF